MMAMWMNAEMTALTQPPFFLSRPADSIRTSSNIAGTSGSELMPTWALRVERAYSCPARRASGFTEELAVGRWPLAVPFHIGQQPPANSQLQAEFTFR